MKIVNLRFDNWNDKITPVVTLQDVPSEYELLYEHKNGIWYAEKEGLVSYMYWRGPGNEGGFGGSVYTIKTKDGRKVKLKGPWSSRAGVVNALGFGPVIDIIAEVNGSRYASAMLVSVLQSYIEDAGFVLRKQDEDGDIVYRIHNKG